MHPNNTEELLQAAEAWLQQGVDDLRQHIEDFMRTENVSVEDLANALALNVEEINAVLEGNVDGVSLRTFAHVLIANGLALAIQPVVETPVQHFGGPQFGTNRRGFMPPPPPGFRPAMGRPMPHMGGAPRGQAGQPVVPQEPHAVEAPQTPLRNARGQFMPRQQRGAAPVTNDPYMRLTVDALRDIITRNHWNYEIDINTANRQEMIDFLKNKEKMTIGGIPSNNGQASQRVVVEETDSKPDTKAEAPKANEGPDVAAIANALAELFKTNPEAAKAFGTLIPKN